MVSVQQSPANVAPERGTTYDAVVIGAGFAGMYMLHRLRDLGMSARVYEQGDDVGGTWYWNRYPGARCDSESVYYMLSDHFSNEILQEWTWTERFAAQPEILRYLQFVADKMDLRRDIQFGTRVTSAVWDEARNRWEIGTDAGDQVSAKFLITAVGCLSTPFTPSYKGLETFQGTWYHSAHWPDEGVDFTGKRVAVIGTGATAVQIVPEVAKQAAHLYVFQRTPSHNIPGRNHPLDADYVRELKASYPQVWEKARETGFGFPFEIPQRSALEVSTEERERIYNAAWSKGGMRFGMETFNDLLVNKASNDTAVEFMRTKIHEVVDDPDVAELLAPKYPFFTKRPPLEHGYYETFNRESVTLINLRRSPIEEITPRGVRTTDAEYDVDCIVFATGFDAMTGTLFAIDIRGRNGVTLKEKWADGPRTYIGLATAGFPNMFMITGPQSPSVLTNMPVAIEQHADWIADCLSYMREHNADCIEATREAEDGWVAHHTQVADATLIPQTDSWWTGANVPGKERLLYPYPGGLDNYRRACDAVAAKDYEGFVLTGKDMGRQDNH